MDPSQPFANAEQNATDFEWDSEQLNVHLPTDIASLPGPSSGTWGYPLSLSTNFDSSDLMQYQQAINSGTSMDLPDHSAATSWAPYQTFQQPVGNLNFIPNNEQQFVNHDFREEAGTSTFLPDPSAATSWAPHQTFQQPVGNLNFIPNGEQQFANHVFREEAGTSTFLPAAIYDGPSAAVSWGPHQPCQQPLGMLDFNPNHEQQLKDHLTGVEVVRRFEPRRQTSARNEALTTFPQQPDMTGQSTNIDPTSYQQVDMSNFGLDHHSDTYNFTATTGFPSGAPGLSHNAFDSSFSQISAQQPQFLNFTPPFHDHGHAMGGMYQQEPFQQNISEPSPFALAPSNVTLSDMEVSEPPYMADKFAHSSDQLLPSGVNMSQTFSSLGIGGNIKVARPALESSFAPDNLNQSCYHPLNTIPPNLISVPVIEQPNNPDLDQSHEMVPSIPLRTRTKSGTTKLSSQRRRISKGSKQNLPLLHGSTYKALENKSGLEIQYYENPEAEREISKTRPRTRKVEHGRSVWACCGCFIRGNKCDNAEGKPCSVCKELMKRISCHTSFPSSICNDHKELSNIIELYPYLIGKPKPVSFYSSFGRISVDEASQLLAPIRKILNVIEPQHTRQIFLFKIPLLAFLSYGFSISRWRSAIKSLQPALEHNIDVVEFFHQSYLRVILESVARRDFYGHKKRFAMAVLVNVVYDDVYSLKSRPEVDNSTVNRFLHALEALISHLYYVLLPEKAIKNDRRKLKGRAIQLASFPLTSKFIPPEYQNCRTIMSDDTVLVHQKRIRTIADIDRIMNFPSSLLFPWPATSSFPRLSQYLPVEFPSIFGFNADIWNTRASGNDDRLFFLLKRSEEILDQISFGSEDLLQFFIILAPHALSMVLKGCLDSPVALIAVAQICRRGQICRRDLMFSIIIHSMRLCASFLDEWETTNDLLKLLTAFPCFSAQMYTWAEESGFLKRLLGL